MAGLDEIVAQLERLEAENTALREELRAIRGPSITPDPSPNPTQASPTVSRRALLGRGATAAVAGVAAAVGATAIGTRVTTAGTQYLILGDLNDSPSGTVLDSPATAAPTFAVYNYGDYVALSATAYDGPSALRATANGTGNGVHAIKPADSPTGHAVLAEQKATNSSYAAAAGVTVGSGPGLYGRADGTGDGVWGNAAGAAAAGVKGTNPNGRGGAFSGRKAQIRLLPSSDTSRPSRGARGDLFVDKSGRLYYCKGGTNWKQLA